MMKILVLLTDDKCSRRPIEIDNDQISNPIESNPHYIKREIAEMLGIPKSNVESFASLSY